MIAIRSFVPALLGLALVSSSPAAETTEASALAVLASKAGVHEKARACQQLAVVGGPAAVPALAALLDHEPLADYARSGLEAIQDPAAGEALRKTLPRLNGRLLAGVVNSLGVRRDTLAVPELQKLALDPKRGVASEALASLGMIGTGETAKTLRMVLTDGSADLRIPAAHAALATAAQLARDGNLAAARELLDEVVRTLPAGHLATAAQRQAASLRANQAPAVPK
ncbi:MAG: HEAT repeat domain-containing protein [Verrucomicrobia bacterium]|nr:HEAT repeat domain-containing protein [Verrucomicrobiota bacterium]